MLGSYLNVLHSVPGQQVPDHTSDSQRTHLAHHWLQHTLIHCDRAAHSSAVHQLPNRCRSGDLPCHYHECPEHIELRLPHELVIVSSDDAWTIVWNH